MAELRWGATTHPGRVRTENEDTFVAEPMVFVVADGMGGHQAGEVASALAASIMRDRLGSGAISEDAAAAAVGEANAAIYGAARANPAQSGMGTTLTAIAVLTEAGSDEERLVLLNVGDSRTYRFRAGRLQRVTVDHSYVQELVAAGHISIEEARTHPRRNIVTRALGIEPVVRADIWTLPIVRGDRYLLASDGLVDEVPDHEILDLVAAVSDPQELSEKLVDIANRHGGRDNVTVVVVDVLEGAEPPDPTDEMQLDPAWAEGVEEPAVWADDHDEAVDLGESDGDNRMSSNTGSDADSLALSGERHQGVQPLPPPPALVSPLQFDLASPSLGSPDVPAPEIGESFGHSSEVVPADDPEPPTVESPAPPPPPGADLAAGTVRVEGPSVAASAQLPIPAAAVVEEPAAIEADAPTAADAPAISRTAAAGSASGMKIANSVQVGAEAPNTIAPNTDSPKPRRRRFTFGAFLFVFLIAAICTVTFTLIAVQARSGYFVGFDDDTVVIYKGQRDSVLWFEPTVAVPGAITRGQLDPDTIRLVESNESFDSSDDAGEFIRTAVVPTTEPAPTTTTQAPSTTTATTAAESTTTTAPEGG